MDQAKTNIPHVINMSKVGWKTMLIQLSTKTLRVHKEEFCITSYSAKITNNVHNIIKDKQFRICYISY